MKGQFSKEPWLIVSGHAIDYKNKTTIVWLWWACRGCDNR